MATGFEYVHLGVRYRLCSLICRQNFAARPQLYLMEGREPVVKQRSFRIQGMPDDAVHACLSALPGVRKADVLHGRCKVEYDLTCITLAQIEHELEQAGAGPIDHGWEHLRRRWVHYSERNELDNLAVPAGACCNRPPRAG